MNSQPSRPVKFLLFGTEWWDKFGIGIWAAQGFHKPMHVGCAFGMDDGTCVGYHAQHEVPNMDLGGFVQFDFDEYRDSFKKWGHRQRGKRIQVMEIPFTRKQIEAKYAKCQLMTRTVKGYAHSQILAKLAHEKKGYPMPEDPDYIDCSEGIGIVLEYRAAGWDLRTDKNPNFDSMTPYEIWRGARNRVRA